MYTETLPKYDIERNMLLKHLFLPLLSYKYIEEDVSIYFAYGLQEKNR